VATEAQPAKQAKLLVVEDDVLIRMLLADMLVARFNQFERI
jgi:hypothetical protein